ncbi:hypothetical protein C9F11_43725 (plasmid) [Streptomyces sp. YIM 121038]|nr:hypothetical protein C9F11_43725 [Streptomyces sp. YIM 121038]
MTPVCERSTVLLTAVLPPACSGLAVLVKRLVAWRRFPRCISDEGVVLPRGCVLSLPPTWPARGAEDRGWSADAVGPIREGEWPAELPSPAPSGGNTSPEPSPSARTLPPTPPSASLPVPSPFPSITTPPSRPAPGTRAASLSQPRRVPGAPPSPAGQFTSPNRHLSADLRGGTSRTAAAAEIARGGAAEDIVLDALHHEEGHDPISSPRHNAAEPIAPAAPVLVGLQPPLSFPPPRLTPLRGVPAGQEAEWTSQEARSPALAGTATGRPPLGSSPLPLAEAVPVAVPDPSTVSITPPAPHDAQPPCPLPGVALVWPSPPALAPSSSPGASATAVSPATSASPAFPLPPAKHPGGRGVGAQSEVQVRAGATGARALAREISRDHVEVLVRAVLERLAPWGPPRADTESMARDPAPPR